MTAPAPLPGFQATLDLTVLGQFFAAEINQFAEGQRRASVRTALSRAFKKYEDFVGNHQFNARINIEEETFEKLVVAYTRAIELHEQQTATGATNAGGVFIETVSDGDFADRTKGQL